jgi:uncharacterized protein YpmS
LEQQVVTAVAGAGDGTVTLEITEAQLTSYIALRAPNQTDVTLSDLQIYLRDQRMQLFGAVNASGISAAAALIMRVTVTENGALRLMIESADFGAIPVPDAVLQQISSNFNQTLNEQLGASGGVFHVSTVSIADGVLTITGGR